MNQTTEQSKNLRHNYIFNLLDGGFFGFGLGFASFSTIIPLFISTMTDRAVLISLVPAVHNVGWQLPQIFTSKFISRLRRFKPFVMLMTTQERFPFLGLAIISWFLGSIGKEVGLLLAYLCLIWQGVGGGLTANAWTNMIGKVIPQDMRGTFFGLQGSAANLMASVGAVLSGFILANLSSPLDFSLCFLICFLLMAVSFIFIGQTREPAREPELDPLHQPNILTLATESLKRNRSFMWFVIGRVFFTFGLTGSAFYTFYPAKFLGMDGIAIGVLTSVLFITQMIANPALGWFADRWSRRRMLEVGAVCAAGAGLLACLSPSRDWFFLINILSGLANAAFWTIGLTILMDFSPEREWPIYIGLGNTLIAPFTFLAPLIGGFIADFAGYQYTFLFSGIAALLTALVFHFLVGEPQQSAPAIGIEAEFIDFS